MRRSTGSDEDLARGAAGGDNAAFAALTRRHRPWVLRLLRAFATETEAEDLAQETFTRLFRHARRYSEHGSFVPYLKRIALNVGRTHLKRTGQTRLVSWDEIGEPVAPDVVDEVLARGLRDEVRDAIATLPAPQQGAVLLRFFAGLSVPEIARQLGCPEGTVKSRLHHGLRAIRARLEERKQLP